MLPWQPILEAKLAVFYIPTLFVTLPFQNRLEYQKADGQVRNGVNFPTSHTNLVSFGSVTVEFCLLMFAPVQKNCKTRHIWPIISEHTLLI